MLLNPALHTLLLLFSGSQEANSTDYSEKPAQRKDWVMAIYQSLATSSVHYLVNFTQVTQSLGVCFLIFQNVLRQAVGLKSKGNDMSYSIYMMTSYVYAGTMIFFFFLVFLGPHLWHVEVPRLGV